MPKLEDLKIKIFCDSANPLVYKDHPLVRGFTTNPSLMYKAGVISYERFARGVLAEITDRPISFEVFADEPKEMIKQAKRISSWGDNIYVKIPITNTKGTYNSGVIQDLALEGIKANITAVMTVNQVMYISNFLSSKTPTIISVFAGRIADTLEPPEPIVETLIYLMGLHTNIEILWASCREPYNILQAEDAGCHIITVTPPILDKLHLVGKDLEQYSLETVQEFYNDAKQAGYEL